MDHRKQVIFLLKPTFIIIYRGFSSHPCLMTSEGIHYAKYPTSRPLQSQFPCRSVSFYDLGGRILRSLAVLKPTPPTPPGHPGGPIPRATRFRWIGDEALPCESGSNWTAELTVPWQRWFIYSSKVMLRALLLEHTIESIVYSTYTIFDLICGLVEKDKSWSNWCAKHAISKSHKQGPRSRVIFQFILKIAIYSEFSHLKNGDFP